MPKTWVIIVLMRLDFLSADPNFPTAQVPAPMPQGPMPGGVQQNTSPAFPPVPDDGTSPMQGIETPDVNDNLSGNAS